VGGWMDGWMDGWTDGRTDGQTDRQTDKRGLAHQEIVTDNKNIRKHGCNISRDGNLVCYDRSVQ
jgi:hypothetical protein